MHGARSPKKLPELIDDRAIEKPDQDELRHAGFAEELAELVRVVRAPSNIALFGSWGAGKTGLGKLLCEELDGKGGVRCVIFDAFKYAEFPLRRHFISQTAASLKVKDPEFTEGLYSEVTSTNFKLPLGKATRVIGFFALAAVVAMAMFFGLAVLVAGILPGSFDKNFDSSLNAGPILLVTPAALLAAFLVLANKWIPIESKRSKPSSEEEFERTFRKLVDKVKAKKLVIFIDELDRCSPREVVTTLEAIRTFLEVTGCVFIVAADQAVLERALSTSLRQATPIDRANPYYSAGSEYLDKVFQYQLNVPPLMPRRLTGFALQLLQNRGGIWEEVDHDRVVSALIPVHVRSPRRVKTLLNGFVSTYRMARRRHEEGALHTPPVDRAAEIAKLVCLRHEFPIFAGDLVNDPRMPEYVLQIDTFIRSGEAWEAKKSDQVRPEVWERAGGYANAELEVDLLLPEADEGSSDAAQLTEARVEHGSQLLAYLRGTHRIRGPARDLIHLETGGEAFGLSPAFADELEEMAVTGDSDETAGRISELEPSEQDSALRLLARRAQEAATSGERRNVLGAITKTVVRLKPRTEQVATDDGADG
jgi:hypothetical protein